jgi:hypothetical protein
MSNRNEFHEHSTNYLNILANSIELKYQDVVLTQCLRCRFTLKAIVERCLFLSFFIQLRFFMLRERMSITMNRVCPLYSFYDGLTWHKSHFSEGLDINELFSSNHSYSSVLDQYESSNETSLLYSMEDKRINRSLSSY